MDHQIDHKDFNREIHEIPAVAPAVAALWRGKQKLWRGEHEPRKLSGEMLFKQNFCSWNRSIRVVRVFRGSPNPCAYLSIRGFKNPVYSVHSVKTIHS